MVAWSHFIWFTEVESVGFVEKLNMKNEKIGTSRDAFDTVHQIWSKQMER